MQPSTLSSWALLIWQELKARGIEPSTVFRELDLDPSLLNQNMARYDMAKLKNLWQKSYELTGDPYIGVAIGERWSPTTFHALGFAWLASTHLLDAFNRLARFSRLLNDALTVTMEENNGNYRFGLHWQREKFQAHPCAWDASQMAVLKMCRLLLGPNFSPLSVHCSLPPADSHRVMEDKFATSIHFNASEDYWLISHFDACKAIPSGNEELAKTNDSVALKYLASLDKAQILPSVQHALTKGLPAGEVSESQIASVLNMSDRTLQRRLEAEGETFSSVLQAVRKELSLKYLENSTMSLTEITYLLGFSEQASFTRAFKRWYGDAPSLFRKKQKAG